MTDSAEKNRDVLRPVWVVSTIMIVFLLLVGGANYVKFQLDRSENTIAAPDTSFAANQDVYERVAHALGYGGFLGAALTVVNQHDRAALDDMRLDLKTAQEALARLPENIPAAVRHDLQGLLAAYTLIATKAAQSFDNGGAALTASDLMPLFAAMPQLDSRLQTALATNRLAAQSATKFWSLMLLLTTCGALFFAAMMALGAYFLARSKQKEALRALAQSVTNIAKGDMRNSVWGLERRDAIGDLARAIDLARYHFSQLPDLSLLSEQGPIRIKFEGETRSLFEAMMRNMADEHDRARHATQRHIDSITEQKALLDGVAARLNTALTAVQQHGVAADQVMRDLGQNLTESTQTIARAQESATLQLSKLLPYMQERAQNMAEVTHIAGSQVTHSLQTLAQAAQEIRQHSAQSQSTVQQLAKTANTASERLFGAVNLMQASGKVLAETTDVVNIRLNEAVETLARGEVNLQNIISRAETRLNNTVNAEANMANIATRSETSAQRMETAVRAITERHEQLSEQVVLATHRLESLVAGFDAMQRSMGDAAGQIQRDGALIGNVLDDLRTNNDKILGSLNQTSTASLTVVQQLAERGQTLLKRLDDQAQQLARTGESRIAEIAGNSSALAMQAQTATTALVQTVGALRAEHDKFMAARSRFGDTIDQFGNKLEHHVTTTIGKTEELAAQSFGKITTLGDQVETVLQRLNILGQLTGTLGSVAGQLGQLLPALTGGQPLAIASAPAPQPTPAVLPEKLLQQIQSSWHQSMLQIEAMHDQLAQLVVQQKDQLETRLIVLDKKIKVSDDSAPALARQAAIMNEIVTTLSKINDHVLELDETVQEAGFKQA